MKKIYTYRARVTTEGTVSIEADSLAEADVIRSQIIEWDCAIVNMEVGSGETFIDATGQEDADADDGTHYMDTPRTNAALNASALDEQESL